MTDETIHSPPGRLLAAVMLLCACSPGGGGAPASTEAAKEPSAQPPAADPPPEAPPAGAAEGVASLPGVLDAYLDLQEKLAGDDAAGARAAYATLGQSLAEATDLPKPLRDSLNTAAQQGAAASELPDQRKVFDTLSETVIGALSELGNPLPGAVHLAHCPMAFDNRGARWMQRSDSLRNPYFGAEMLTCGAIDASVASGQRLPASAK